MQRESLQKQLEVHRRNLCRLELRLAKYTLMDAPLSLLNQIDGEKTAIAELERHMCIMALDENPNLRRHWEKVQEYILC
jgi:hypothetical protein